MGCLEQHMVDAQEVFFCKKINKGYDFNYHLDDLMQENLLAFGQQINEKDVRNSHEDSL